MGYLGIFRYFIRFIRSIQSITAVTRDMPPSAAVMSMLRVP